MCDCKENLLDLSSLKIYTLMATYKALKKLTIYHGTNSVIRTASASQEELAYLYDVLGATDAVEKIEKTKDGSKKSKKQSKDIDKEQE